MQTINPFQGQSDQQLAAKSSQGNERAFEVFFHRRFQSLYDFAIRIVRDSDAAADVVQTTFVKTWEQLNQGTIPENINAWMYTLARNAAIDELRRRKRTTVTDFSSEETERLEAYSKYEPKTSISPQRALENKELVDMVWRAATMLRPEEYSLLDLYLRRGLKPAELADALGLRRGTVYTRISRLKDSLEESIIVDFLIRRGRTDCNELNKLVSAYERADASDRLRYHVSKHFDTCPLCQETKLRHLSPTEIFAGLALIPVPVALKQNIWARISSEIARGLIRWAKLRGAMKLLTTRNALIAGTGLTILTLAGTVMLTSRTPIERPGENQTTKILVTQTSSTRIGQVSGSAKTPAPTESELVEIPQDSTSENNPIEELTDQPGPSSTATETATATVTPSPTVTGTPTATMTSTISPTPSFTPTFTSSPTPTSTPLIWLQDNFDNLSTGNLNGQNGWSASENSAKVINFSGMGRVAKLDPSSGATIAMSKNFANQSSGIVWYEFDVMVIDGDVHSMAKFEMTTKPNAGWDKKFQVYFGTSFRINYSGSGGSTTIVSSTVMDRWYRIRCQLNLANDRLKVWVDGNLVAENIPMHSGVLTQIAIWGWDKNGYVLLDNLLGTK